MSRKISFAIAAILLIVMPSPGLCMLKRTNKSAIDNIETLGTLVSSEEFKMGPKNFVKGPSEQYWSGQRAGYRVREFDVLLHDLITYKVDNSSVDENKRFLRCPLSSFLQCLEVPVETRSKNILNNQTPGPNQVRYVTKNSKKISRDGVSCSMQTDLNPNVNTDNVFFMCQSDEEPSNIMILHRTWEYTPQQWPFEVRLVIEKDRNSSIQLVSTPTELAIVDYRAVQSGTKSRGFQYLSLPMPTAEDLRSWSENESNSSFRTKFIEKFNG